MLVKFMLGVDTDTHYVKLGGFRYKFVRNAKGDLVCDIQNTDHLKWISQQNHYTSLQVYDEGSPAEPESIPDAIPAPEMPALPNVETMTSGLIDEMPAASEELLSLKPPTKKRSSKRG